MQPVYLKFAPLAPHGSGAVAGHDGVGPDPAPRHRGALARPLLNETGVPGLSNRNFHQAIRTATHKYVEHADGERELYDLLSDPDELVSVAGDPAQAATLAELDAKLEVLKTCAGASCVDPQPPATPSPSPPSPTVPDTVTPVGRSVRLLDRRIRLGRDKRIGIPMRCALGADDGCTGTLTLYERRKHRLVRVGSRRFSLEPGQSRRVEVKVRAAARRRLARKGRLTVRVSARYVTVAGELERAKRNFRLLARSQR